MSTDAAATGGPARPLLVVCLALVVGAALGGRAPGLPWVWPALAALLLLVAAREPWPRLGGWCLLALSVGGYRAEQVTQAWFAHPLHALAERSVELEGVVREPPQPRRAGGEFALLKLQRLRVADGPWRALAGGVRVDFPGHADLAPGDQLRVVGRLAEPGSAGNPGSFSYRAKLQREGIHLVCRPSEPPRVVGRDQAGWLVWASHRWRTALCGAVRAAMPGPCARDYADLLNGLVFGVYAAPVAAPLDEAFRRAGLTHLLVASGTQVSILLALVLLCARAVPGAPPLTFAVGVATLAAYVLVTGLEPSILRAALMGLVLLLSVLSGRDYDLPTSLGVAGALILLWEPLTLGDIGFQLSFAATAGLVLVGVPLAEWLQPRLGWWLGGVPALTCGAQLCVAPLLIYHFRRFSVAGLVSNLPAIPLSGLLVPLGLLAAGLGLLSRGLAAVVCVVLRALLLPLVESVGALARWRHATLEGVVMTPFGFVLVGLAIGLCAFALDPVEARRRLRWWTRERLVLGSLMALAATLGWRAWSLAEAGLTLRVMDVGEGDALLLRGPTGRTMLIDGGPREEHDGQTFDAGADKVVPALMLLGVRRLDDVVGTHEHADHLGGLASVLQSYPGARVWLSAGTLASAAPAVAALQAAARRGGSSVAPLARGQSFDLGGGARVEVLWPPDVPLSGTKSDANNNSVVLRATYGQTAYLLAADLEAAGEEALLRSGVSLRASVLKVGHQGSATSTTPRWLAAVAPRWAAISVGPNQFGHPSPELLARLRAAGAQVSRTDVEGMITYRSDGRTVRLWTYGRR